MIAYTAHMHTKKALKRCIEVSDINLDISAVFFIICRNDEPNSQRIEKYRRQ